jgi:dihydrofolate reductase
VLSGDPADAVRKLKEDGDGVLLIAGSAQLVQALTDAGLVDEYRLMVFPLVIGAGKRLWAETSAPAALQLVESKPVGGDGVVIQRYVPKGD